VAREHGCADETRDAGADHDDVEAVGARTALQEVDGQRHGRSSVHVQRQRSPTGAAGFAPTAGGTTTRRSGVPADAVSSATRPPRALASVTLASRSTTSPTSWPASAGAIAGGVGSRVERRARAPRRAPATPPAEPRRRPARARAARRRSVEERAITDRRRRVEGG